jgi:hypothetical protein
VNDRFSRRTVCSVADINLKFFFATGEVEFTEEFSRLGIKCRHAFEAAESITRGYDREDVHGLVKFVRLVDHLDVLAIGSALDRAIKEFRPEIVHCWSDLANVIGGLVSTDLGVPRVVLGQRNLPVFRSIHGMEPYACRDAYRLLIRNLNVVVLNNSLAGLVGYARWLDVPNKKIKLLYNGSCRKAFTSGSKVRVKRAVGILVFPATRRWSVQSCDLHYHQQRATFSERSRPCTVRRKMLDADLSCKGAAATVLTAGPSWRAPREKIGNGPPQ